MIESKDCGKKICMLSSARPATEHRMLPKQAVSLARAGYRVSIVAPHPHDDVLFGIAIKAVRKCTSRTARVVLAASVYREALRQRADIYHLHDTGLIPVGWLLKLRGKHVIYDVREDTPAYVSDQYWIPR